MADHGGGGTRRVLAPPPSVLTSRFSSVRTPILPPPPLPPTSSSMLRPSNQNPVFDRVTLAQPRPGVARARNEYIETPLRPQISGSSPKVSASKLDSDGPLRPLSGRTSPATGVSLLSSSSSIAGIHHPPHLHPHHPAGPTRLPSSLGNTQLPILTQPSVTFKKAEQTSTSGGGDVVTEEPSHSGGDSIICSECRRCKCDACRNPRPLPSTWICGNKYHCSAEITLDYCSCMCCVKGLFYHCAKDYEMDDDVSCADKPCSCNPHRRCVRWGCIGLLSTMLPCLLCYWPLKGCLKLCETCYRNCNSNGCRCDTDVNNTSSANNQGKRKDLDTLPNKRLLDTSVEC